MVTEARTKPGSRSHRLVQITQNLNQRYGRGVEVSEIRDAYEAEEGEPPPKSLTSEIGSLKRRGVLHMVGGRAGRSLYAVDRLRYVGKQNPDDDALLVLKALQSGYRKLQRPLSTREVADEVAIRGELQSDDLNAVKKYLETLSRTRKRGPKSFLKPQVHRIEAVTEVGGPTAHWIPASAAREGAVYDPAPRSAAEAVRQGIRVVEDELGQPPSGTEFRWWLQSQEADPGVRELIPDNRVGRILSRAAESDSRYPGYPGRIHALRGPLTCHGGAAERYSWGPPMFVAPCALEDALQIYLPADETESIGLLVRRAQSIQSEAFEEIADIRTRLLTFLVHNAGGEEGAATDWIPALERIGIVHRRWIANTPALSRDQVGSRERVIRDREHQLTALKHLLRQPCPIGEAPARSVGSGALSSLSDLQDFLEAAVEMEGGSPKRSEWLVSSARRFPVPEPPGRERFGAADQLPLSLIDRVDALHALFELMPTPRAAMLLSQGELVLGRVFRDADVIERLFRSAPEAEAVTRRALVVALGLLGRHLAFEEVVPDLSNYEDTATWVFSVVLAEGPGAWSIVNQADRKARGAARKITDAALARIQVRYLFSIVG